LFASEESGLASGLTARPFHGLILWNSVITTFPDALQQEVNQGQHDENQQQKDLPNAQVFS
jgi:hypothetical protein